MTIVSEVVVVEVRRGKDHKLYPAVMRLPRAELNKIRRLTHKIHCEGGLTEAATRRELLEGHGIRRSAGIVHRDLAAFECPACAGGPPEPRRPEPEPSPPEPAPRQPFQGGDGWAGPAPW